MLNKSFIFAFAIPLFAISAVASASDDCSIIIPGGWPVNPSSGVPIAIVASHSGPAYQCKTALYQQAAAVQAALQGIVIVDGNGGDPVGDGKAGCGSTILISTPDPKAPLPYATIEEYPRDINVSMGLVISQWNQNWALETWKAVQVKADFGQTKYPVTIQLRRTEAQNDSGYVTDLEVLDQDGAVLRVLPNINTAQLLQIRITTTERSSEIKRIRVFLSSTDTTPAVVDIPSHALTTLRYGADAQLAENVATGASGWVGIFPCVSAGTAY